MSHPSDPRPASPTPPPLPPLTAQNPQHPYPPPQAVLPYATPYAQPQAGYPAWRDGPKLVTPAYAALPPRCVKCGAPADGHYVQRVFWWYHPAFLLLLFAGILIFAIVALIVRKKATVQLGLCAAHLSRRRHVIAVVTVMSLAGLAAIVGGFYAMEAYRNDTAPILCTLAALALWITAAVVYSKLGTYLTPTRIDDHYAYFKGAGPDFLSLFPTVR